MTEPAVYKQIFKAFEKTLMRNKPATLAFRPRKEKNLWSLREYSKTNPKWVKNFINKYRDELAPLSIREASKYL
jgi:3-methyladenine DNA glycosylase AlkD